MLQPGPLAATSEARSDRRVVLATVPSDAHTWNLIFLELLLEESGFEVTNLGPCTPAELVVNAADDPCVRAVILSSVNGHGAIEGQHFVPLLHRLGLRQPVAMGGKLGTDANFESARNRLVAAGCDRVFDPAEAPTLLVDWLEGFATDHAALDFDPHSVPA